MRKGLAVIILAVGIGASAFFSARAIQGIGGGGAPVPPIGSFSPVPSPELIYPSPLPGTYEGEINGFRVTRTRIDWKVAGSICDRLDLPRDTYTAEGMAQKLEELRGTIWDLQPSYLPAGVQFAGLSLGVPSSLGTCSGGQHVEGTHRSWGAKGLGSISIFRSAMQVPTIYGPALEDLTKITIRGKPALLERGRFAPPGVDLERLPVRVFVNEGGGVITEIYVTGNFASSPRQEAIKIAEGLK